MRTSADSMKAGEKMVERMPEIVLYTTNSCPFCLRAKELLARRGLSYREIDVGSDGARRQEMTRITGRRSVPQVVLDGIPAGGYQELVALVNEGKL